MVADCSLRIEALLLLNVPLLRFRSPAATKVLPVTSRTPEAPRVRPPVNLRVPPVEVMDPDVSDNAFPRVKFTFFCLNG